jgi:hypothetical protein
VFAKLDLIKADSAEAQPTRNAVKRFNAGLMAGHSAYNDRVIPSAQSWKITHEI